jgi:hypothetical protein
MRAAFQVAIGISAIDALLSAFTAVVLLALVIASPASDHGGSLAKETHILRIEKSAPVRLLLDIQSAQTPTRVAQLASSRFAVLKYDAADFLFSKSAGQLSWADPPCAKCASIVTIVAPKGSWNMRFRIAGDAADSDGVPTDLSLTIIRLGDKSADPNCARRPLPVGDQLLLAVGFGRGGRVVCRI